jgi:transposase
VGVKRKQHSSEFKARVAMAALSGEKTLAELSVEFGVHPTMISNWKQELVKRAGELFARGSKAPAAEDAQKVIDDLHRKIGQLQVERDFLAGQPAISIIGAGRSFFQLYPSICMGLLQVATRISC